MNQSFGKKKPENEWFAAVQSGDLRTLRTCIAKSGHDIEMRDSDGWSALHHAVYSMQRDAVRLLLELGANPNAKEELGGTPLHWACEVGDLKSADCLLWGGADVNACDNSSRTALADALLHGYWEIVELLATAGADWFAENDLGHSPFHLVFGGLDFEKRKQVVDILGRTAASSPSAGKALTEYRNIRA